MPKTVILGTCLCRAVAFTITRDDSRWMEHCHCSMCRKSHGASFVTWIDVPDRDFTLTRGQAELVSYRSSADADRKFCCRCGASLFWKREGSSEITIAAGCLDDDPGCRPGGHIYVASKAPWVEIEDGLPQWEASRPPRKKD